MFRGAVYIGIGLCLLFLHDQMLQRCPHPVLAPAVFVHFPSFPVSANSSNRVSLSSRVWRVPELFPAPHHVSPCPCFVSPSSPLTRGSIHFLLHLQTFLLLD